MSSYREIVLRVYDPEPMPESIQAFSNKDIHGYYNIFLSAGRTEQERTADLLHEFLHIWHDDHDRQQVNIEQIELERREELARALQVIKAETIKQQLMEEATQCK